jgi:hypothetical protein
MLATSHVNLIILNSIIAKMFDNEHKFMKLKIFANIFQNVSTLNFFAKNVHLSFPFWYNLNQYTSLNGRGEVSYETKGKTSGQSSWLLNGDVLCFLWGTNWIYICYVEESRPPLWSSGQNSWLQNWDALCFLWGTNWICICYVEESRPPLWSSGQNSWLQNWDALFFLRGTKWICIFFVEESIQTFF